MNRTPRDRIRLRELTPTEHQEWSYGCADVY
jgi:hypothetical protein